MLPAAKEGLTGSFSGLKARGNITVSAKFTDSRVTEVSLYAPTDMTVAVKVNGEMYSVELLKNKEAVITL